MSKSQQSYAELSADDVIEMCAKKLVKIQEKREKEKLEFLESKRARKFVWHGLFHWPPVAFPRESVAETKKRFDEDGNKAWHEVGWADSLRYHMFNSYYHETEATCQRVSALAHASLKMADRTLFVTAADYHAIQIHD